MGLMPHTQTVMYNVTLSMPDFTDWSVLSVSCVWSAEDMSILMEDTDIMSLYSVLF